jgi:hypothetical protein
VSKLLLSFTYIQTNRGDIKKTLNVMTTTAVSLAVLLKIIFVTPHSGK